MSVSKAMLVNLLRFLTNLFLPPHAATVSIKHSDPWVSSGGAKLEGAEWVGRCSTDNSKTENMRNLLSATNVVSVPQRLDAHTSRSLDMHQWQGAAPWLKQRAAQIHADSV